MLTVIYFFNALIYSQILDSNPPCYNDMIEYNCPLESSKKLLYLKSKNHCKARFEYKSNKKNCIVGLFK